MDSGANDFLFLNDSAGQGPSFGNADVTGAVLRIGFFDGVQPRHPGAV